MYRSRIAAFAVAVLMTACLSVTAPGGASAHPYPVASDPLQAVARGLTTADAAPPGANINGCRDRHGRDPIVLVHGTALNQLANWSFLAPTLANKGFCVYSFTYGKTAYSGNSGAIASMYRSADELDEFVNSVLRQSGGDRVDLIGHSQGGAVQRIYSDLPGRASKIGTMVGLAAANSGVTTTSGAKPLLDLLPVLRDGLVFRLCPACAELNDPKTYRPAIQSIHYYNVIGTSDEVITPYTVGLLSSASNVINQTVQSVCPRSRVGHLGIAFDPAVAQMIVNALDPRRASPVTCDVGFGL